MKKLLFLVNVDWFFLSHRLPIAIEALNYGYEVHVATGITDKLDVLRSYGLIVHPLTMGRSSTGIVGEVRTFMSILRIFMKVKPNIVHLVTIKPVLFGGIAARLAGVPAVVAAISGLGFVFSDKGKKATVIRFFVSSLYRLVLGKRNLKVICQNPDDRETLVKAAGLKQDKVMMISGSGVDLSAYAVTPLSKGVPVVVMAARLLRDKGVLEFVAAARLLTQRNVAVRFWLAGDPDPGNPATVTLGELSAWENEGCVEILGYREDIPNLFAQANIVVLPSYYGEGLPKTLVEAAACGRAVVTTDHPGCRDAIEPGKSGLLVPVKDSIALADAIQRLIDDRELCHSMGRAGRVLAEREFAIEKIVDAHLKIYKELEVNA
ncbi:Glycosyltransferase involved in cell wall bisynthesis [Desulfuromusa kysingii]|uniref:Glycosyltransferase involved in cell wall bisynthesis n=1 Tax=Desulfuromusa kysingii TaxID=37625 RepID=A0A1H3YI37_9BACT|nr:glycosyltransferase family 4 protein [Desulfuromusa kysingii]SEA11207.1 Glycosyltransferase involved in cell wall bisynthesis [Desulfuromusa kysingii]